MLSCVVQGATVTAEVRRREGMQNISGGGPKYRDFRFIVKTEEHCALEFLAVGTITKPR